MLSSTDSGLSSSDQGHCVLGQDTFLSQCPSPWVPASLLQGSITLQWTSIPSWGEGRVGIFLVTTETATNLHFRSVCEEDVDKVLND